MTKLKYPQLSDRKWLLKEVKNKSLLQISEELGCSYSAVAYQTAKQKINVPYRAKRRVYATKSESQKRAYKEKYPDGRFAELHPRWAGGRVVRNNYIMLYAPDHPRAKKGRPHVFEHILVAEKTLGRYLTTDEVVHHINGDKQDNRPENLEVLLRKDHVHAHHIKGTRITGLYKEIERLKTLLDKNGIVY